MLPRYSRIEHFVRRQLSATERMAATFEVPATVKPPTLLEDTYFECSFKFRLCSRICG